MNYKPVEILELDGEFTVEEINRFRAKIKEALNASPWQVPILYTDETTRYLQLLKRDSNVRPETEKP